MPFDSSSHFSLFCMLKLLKDHDDTKSSYSSNTRVTNESNVLPESEVFNWRKRFHPASVVIVSRDKNPEEVVSSRGSIAIPWLARSALPR